MKPHVKLGAAVVVVLAAGTVWTQDGPPTLTNLSSAEAHAQWRSGVERQIDKAGDAYDGVEIVTIQMSDVLHRLDSGIRLLHRCEHGEECRQSLAGLSAAFDYLANRQAELLRKHRRHMFDDPLRVALFEQRVQAELAVIAPTTPLPEDDGSDDPFIERTAQIAARLAQLDARTIRVELLSDIRHSPDLDEPVAGELVLECSYFGDMDARVGDRAIRDRFSHHDWEGTVMEVVTRFDSEPATSQDLEWNGDGVALMGSPEPDEARDVHSLLQDMVEHDLLLLRIEDFPPMRFDLAAVRDELAALARRCDSRVEFQKTLDRVGGG